MSKLSSPISLNSSVSLPRWKSPSFGCIKFNSDASIYSRANSVNLGGVFRDEYSMVIAAFARNLLGNSLVDKSELPTIREGLLFVDQENIKVSSIECDAFRIINGLHSSTLL
ncbi:hypothetical protein PanWU01x14_026000 [Parasponia andersonii]|uniref:Uncharacterized protein n=1 Tax=Parasponia andersonii TaxID=3476 RepID=A0A2P5DW09_PARAD|nr:hypothetical protein PanWU01x14_026000 [Parasponia andersonii]